MSFESSGQTCKFQTYLFVGHSGDSFRRDLKTLLFSFY